MSQTIAPPQYTAEGFKKVRLPEWLFQVTTNHYNSYRSEAVPEQSDAIGTYVVSSVSATPAYMIPLCCSTRTVIVEEVTKLLEEWVGKALTLTAIYGIREYQDGTTLKMHVDRVETHHVSAIINVAQDVKSDWPLMIYDHSGELHTVFMQPGEAILYESARLQHGRPDPLDGNFFANIFVHTKETTNV